MSDPVKGPIRPVWAAQFVIDSKMKGSYEEADVLEAGAETWWSTKSGRYLIPAGTAEKALSVLKAWFYDEFGVEFLDKPDRFVDGRAWSKVVADVEQGAAISQQEVLCRI